MIFTNEQLQGIVSYLLNTKPNKRHEYTGKIKVDSITYRKLFSKGAGHTISLKGWQQYQLSFRPNYSDSMRLTVYVKLHSHFLDNTLHSLSVNPRHSINIQEI